MIFPERKGTDSLKWAKYINTDVLPMWVADMDFQSAPEILSALHQRIEQGIFGYAVPTQDTINAVMNWLKTRHHWTIRPNWIVWVPGLVSALNIVCRAYADPGEQILTFTPVYQPFLSAPKLSHRQLLTCPLQNNEGQYSIDFEQLESTLTDKTRIILLCSPHNPVGRVWNRTELQSLTRICLARNITLCSDEIHCDLILNESVQHSVTAALSEETAQNTITLMSPAKTFNLPGLNCGYAVIPNERLRRQFKNAAAGIVPHVNALGYTACRAAYNSDGRWLKDVLGYLHENHQILYHTINQFPGLSMAPVEATYLAWIDVRQLNIDKPGEFFEKAGVGVTDGTEFGQEGYVRLNFACSRDHLQLALERIHKALISH